MGWKWIAVDNVFWTGEYWWWKVIFGAELWRRSIFDCWFRCTYFRTVLLYSTQSLPVFSFIWRGIPDPVAYYFLPRNRLWRRPCTELSNYWMSAIDQSLNSYCATCLSNDVLLWCDTTKALLAMHHGGTWSTDHCRVPGALSPRKYWTSWSDVVTFPWPQDLEATNQSIISGISPLNDRTR